MTRVMSTWSSGIPRSFLISSALYPAMGWAINPSSVALRTICPTEMPVLNRK
jgi:hypothetical protein